jgi:hypothetical protein
MKALLRLLPIGLVLLIAACSSSAASSAPAAAGGDGAPAASEGDSGGTDTGGGLNACLNSNEEVSAALGVEIEEAENTEAAGGASCIYYTDKEAFESALLITVQGGQTVQIARESFFTDPSWEPVSGIGDEAGWFGGNNLFMAVKGDQLLSIATGIAVQDMDDEGRSALEELTRLAIDDL